jgi:poly(3-hydroxybutyrate) depolymerase
MLNEECRMKSERRGTAAAGLILLAVTLLAVPAAAQAPPSLMSARVLYMTQKAKVSPQGDLAAALGALEKEFAEAIRLGKNGEARRLLAKGMALLAGDAWTPQLEYARSLVLRSDHTIADSSKPLVVRLEQIYSPAIDLPNSMSARVSMTQRPARAPGAAPSPGNPQPEDIVVKAFDAVSPIARDLRDAPLAMELDLKGVPDGTYRLRAEVRNGEQVLGTATLTVATIDRLDDRLGRLSAGAASVPESVKADVLSPVDFVRNVNLSRIGLGAALDLKAAVAGAEAVLSAARSGKDPFAGRTGDITRHYLFKPVGEILPYRLYVPTTYDKSKAVPLIVALHGLGGSEASFFEAYERRLPAIAEKHGYLLVAPLGYRPDGFYGWGVGDPPADPAARQLQERSEQDVMEVLALVKRDYRVDESRIYLMGHSMGAIGTWRLAAKYPDVWAAIGPISGSGAPATVERMKGIPQVVVHGDKDPTVPVNSSRLMVAEMKRLGVEVQYIEVPGGDHGSVVPPNLENVVAFFDAHRKK